MTGYLFWFILPVFNESHIQYSQIVDNQETKYKLVYSFMGVAYLAEHYEYLTRTNSIAGFLSTQS
ncbi:hypothetical protein BD779DRAFT_1534546 [Infundibulicybe gibba]|nr:hypothetical protein BD779DRAFT_1534546 [Infundibulicybe gibba]